MEIYKGMAVFLLSPRVINDEEKYEKYTVQKIIPKNGYNMYVCENQKTKIKPTFTDMDIKVKGVSRGLRAAPVKFERKDRLK